MYPRFLLAVIIIAAIFFLMRWFMKNSPHDVARTLKKTSIYLGITLLIFLAATGRLHWLFALIGSVLAFLPRLLPILRYIPILNQLMAYTKRAKAASGPTPGQRSNVETRYLKMSLHLDTGEMTGIVLGGQFKGRQLTGLSLDELIDLLAECHRHDEQSVALLEAYLDRTHGDNWRQQSYGYDANSEHSTDSHGKSGTTITTDEAYEILGLSPGANKEEIIAAHRKLMQKMHPDRGGSDYLAAKINQAKDILLNK